MKIGGSAKPNSAHIVSKHNAENMQIRGAKRRASLGELAWKGPSFTANAQVKPTRVAEQTAWQAVPAMLFVERHEFGLNALLGRLRASLGEAEKHECHKYIGAGLRYCDKSALLIVAGEQPDYW